MIGILTNKEIKEFSSVMNYEKRKSLKRLFEFIVKKKITVFEDKKDEIFSAAFNQAYSKGNDYLIRNEFRLLNKKLEIFLSQKSMPKRDQQFYYLQALFNRNQVRLFEIEIKKALSQATGTNDWEGVGRLLELNLLFRIKTATYNEESLNQNMEICNQVWRAKERSHQYDHAKLAVKMNFFINYHRIIGNNEKVSTLPDMKYDENDICLTFFKAKAQSFLQEGEPKKKALKQALKVLEDVNYWSLEKGKERIGLLNNLAIEQLLSRTYKLAADSFSKLLAMPGLSSQVLATIAFNYLTCLLKSGQYKMALKLIKEGTLDEDGFVGLRGTMNNIVAMAYVYNKEYESAFEVIPNNLKEGSRQDYFYSRLVLSIIYWSDGIIDMAIREVDNLLQIIEPNEKKSDVFRYCAQFLKTFMSNPNDTSKKKALRQKNNNFIKTGGQKSDLLPFLWLRDQLKPIK